jgi:hypothetical protein
MGEPVRLSHETIYTALYAMPRGQLLTWSLCLQTSSGSAIGLDIFNGDNIEDRIMRLTMKNKSFCHAALLGLVLAIGVTFGSGAVFAP